MSKEFTISEEEILAAQNRQNITPLRPIKPVDAITFDQLKLNPPHPIKNILSPILQERGLMFVYAETGLGKTFFTLNLAYAIASGGKFLKYSASSPKKVLYIDAELQYKAMYERLIKIEEQQGTIDFPENFAFYTPDKFTPRGQNNIEALPKICNPEGQMFYEMMIEEKGYEVVFFDNLSLLSEIDINKYNEWSLIQNWLIKLQTKGVAVVMVHHAGKSNDYLGTSRMMHAAHTVIALENIKEETQDKPISIKKFKISYDKNRNFFGMDAIPYEATFDGSIWTYRSIAQSDMDGVVECLKANMSQRDIAQYLGISQTKVNRLAKEARLTGRLVGI